MSEEEKKQRKKTSYSSNYVGISTKNGKKWSASIRIEGKLICLGIFDSQEIAAKKYDQKARSLNLPVNFPRDNERKAIKGKINNKICNITIRCKNAECLNQNNNNIQIYCEICKKNNIGPTINREKRIKRMDEDQYQFIKHSCTQKYNNEISPEDYKEKLISQHNNCYWCNISLTHQTIRKNEIRKGSEMVLDRIDNDIKMHTKDNTVISCYLCNTMRGCIDFNLFNKIIYVLKRKETILDLRDISVKMSTYNEPGSNALWGMLKDTYSDVDEQKKIFFNLYENQEKRCALSNLPFVISQGTKKEYSFSTPSVDRINSINENGIKMKHFKGNVQIIWSMFNRAKLDWNQEYFNKIMLDRFPSWNLGYKDVEIIFPNDHQNNWIDNYVCKNEEYHINNHKKNLEDLLNYLKKNKKKPLKSSKNKTESDLAKWWEKFSKPYSRCWNRENDELKQLLNEFKKSDEYCEYLLTNEEKVKDLVEQLKKFMDENDRLPSVSKLASDDEKILANKFYNIKKRLPVKESQLNKHYNILIKMMESLQYKNCELKHKKIIKK